MKKFIAVLVIFLCMGTAAFAQIQMSAGVGGSFTAAFDGGGEFSLMGFSGGIEFPYTGGSIYAFFDATYVEASIGLFFGTIEMTPTGLMKEGGMSKTSFKVDGLTLALLGKYPFDLGFMTLFPAVGIEYLAITKATSGNVSYSDAKDLSHLWIKFGVGADFSITEQIYIRGTVLYGIRLESKAEKDMNDLIQDEFSSYGVDVDWESKLGHGIQIKVAVGWKF